MEESMKKWLRSLSKDDAQYKRFCAQLEGSEKYDDDYLTPAEEREVEREITEEWEAVKPESIGMDIGEDEPINEAERQGSEEAEAELWEHAEKTHRSLGIPFRSRSKVETKRIKESRITEPARVSSFREDTHKVGTVKDGMTMCGPGLWLPSRIAENGTDDEILEYLEENKIGLA